MPQIAAFIPLITAVAGPLLNKALGGGKEAAAAKGGAAAAPAKQLFTPDQITQATDRYSKEGNAKWSQIMSNMGAGGGTGGQNYTEAIGNQAKSLGSALGGLTTASGYGDNPMANLDAILRSTERSINPQYAVY